uniref:Succinylglutamate desuccinylase n=1 Tax=uncultured Thiotrichaceae bacterium TaxID=298394 RepID=A0A6S6TDF9_9GAMM|nr:MAG: Succinylglutamate desuccinylase [uncultured Thiotrichaceae bacterium]
MGMLSPSKSVKAPSMLSHGSKWVRSPQSGILRVAKSMGAQVNKGDILGYVADPFGTSEEVIHSHLSGVIIGQATLPLVHEGEALFHVAGIGAGEDIDDNLRQFHHEIDPDMENISS